MTQACRRPEQPGPSWSPIRRACTLARPWPLPRPCAAGKSRVTLVKDQEPVAGTDVLQILTMVTHQGETVTLEAVGPDAEAVLARLSRCLPADSATKPPNPSNR